MQSQLVRISLSWNRVEGRVLTAAEVQVEVYTNDFLSRPRRARLDAVLTRPPRWLGITQKQEDTLPITPGQKSLITEGLSGWERVSE
jgi:hypothetical protein